MWASVRIVHVKRCFYVAGCFVLATALIGCSEDDPADASGVGAGGGQGGQGGQGGVAVPGNYQDNFVQLSRGPGSTFVEITEVRAAPNNQLLYCSGVQGLTALDVSDPANPTRIYQLGSSAGSGQYPRCQHLALADAALYITNRGDEIQPTPFVTAFDVATTPPSEQGTYTETGVSFEGIAAEGNLLFAAAHQSGLRILDNNGTTLALRSSLGGFTNAWAVDEHLGMLYVADGEGGLAVVDATNPSAPAIVGRATLEGPAQHVAFDPDTMTAYVAAGGAGMIVVDVQNPAAPAQIGRVDTPGTTLQIALSDGRAVLADWNDVRVYDISEPASPQLVAVEIVDTGEDSRVLGASVAGNIVFAGEWTGLYAYELFPELSVPHIRLADRVVDIGNVAEGEAFAKAVIVENEGPEPLVITWLEGFGLTVSAEQVPFAIEPGGKAAVEVTMVGAAGPVTTSLDVWSDDPDDEMIKLFLDANTPNLGVGDPAPNATVNLITGGTWSLSDQLGSVVVLSYFATF
jgi:hypothetical protein